MTVDELNVLSFEAAYADLHKCCGAKGWVTKMADLRPFKTHQDVFEAADTIWLNLSPSDWKEAFQHHPKIGDADSFREKFAPTALWAEGEQAGLKNAPDDVLNKLAEGNRQYEEKYGYIFVVCATGKSAEEMLQMLERRMKNEPEDELALAAEEQRKVTRIRLEKLLR